MCRYVLPAGLRFANTALRSVAKTRYRKNARYSRYRPVIKRRTLKAAVPATISQSGMPDIRTPERRFDAQFYQTRPKIYLRLACFEAPVYPCLPGTDYCTEA